MAYNTGKLAKDKVCLDKTELALLRSTLIVCKNTRDTLQHHLRGIPKKFGVDHPYTQFCLPLIHQIRTLVKNNRAKTLHALLDEKLADPALTVTVDLRQFFKGDEQPLATFTARDLTLTIPFSSYSATAASTIARK